MASKIKIKRSAVAGKVPLTTDLELSELAVNTNDGRLYTKKDDGTESIVEIGGPDFGSRNVTTSGSITVTNQGDIRLGEATANGSNYVALQAPASLAADVTYTLPAADGTSGQVLSTNGSGTLSWATASGGASVTTSDTAPSSPSDGDLWYDSVGGRTYVYYQDPNGSQWVDASPQGGGGSGTSITTGNTTAEVIDTGSDGRFVVTTEGTERLRVDSSGRLGIGNPTPTYLFDVQATSGNGIRYRATSTGFGLYIGDNSGTPFLSTDSASPLTFGIQNTERARIDSSGRLLIGTSSARTFVGGAINIPLQVEGANNNDSRGGSVTYGANNTAGPLLCLAKHRSNSIGGTTVVASGDETGGVLFHGSDGANLVQSASIYSYVDGTPGTNDMPGRLVFSTTADGASSPTERFRIQSSGDWRIGNATTFYPQVDNAISLGSGPAGPFRFSALWAANGTIQTSDQRAKTDVADAALGSEFIKSLRPVSYKWTEGGKRDTGERDEDGNFIYESVPGTRTHWGFIAQEVKQAVDAAGVDFGGWVLTDKDDPDSQQALRYDQFIAPLTKALQEAIERIETLEAQNASLEARLTALEGGN